MTGACPIPGPDDPLVRGLISTVDCNVQALVQTGYGALLQPGGAFASVLTVLSTLFVALIGYQLLLGRSQLSVTDFALSAVKLGAVTALATQWGLYQAVVYHFLFFGPQQIADVMLHALHANGSLAGGDVFDGLQRAFADLTAFSPAAPPGPLHLDPNAAASLPTPNPLSTLLSRAGFDALMMLISAVILLAVGPVFIALMLFDATRGLFEGWLRASLAFAFAPLAVTLLLGLALAMLDPTLDQIETMRTSGTYIPGVAFTALVLVVVFAGVSLGLVAAGGVIALGFRLPRPRRTAPEVAGTAASSLGRPQAAPPARSARIAAAVAAQDRRDAMVLVSDLPALGGEDFSPTPARERRTTISTIGSRVGQAPEAAAARLGQATRRAASPRTGRSGSRTD